MADPAVGGTPGGIVQPGGPAPAPPVNPTLSISTTELLRRKPHTRPKRAIVTVGTSATNFPRDGVLARSGPEVRLFDAARGGSEIGFSPTGTLVVSSADLNANRQFFAEAAGFSSRVGGTTLALSLVGGSAPTTGPPQSVSFTCIELGLDVGGPRPAPGVAPTLLSQPPATPPGAGPNPTDKWFGGRTVSAQNAQRSQRRAQLLIQKPKPSNFSGTLVLRQVRLSGNSVAGLDTSVQVLQREVPVQTGVETPFPNPANIPTTLVSSGPLERWAEGKSLSAARRATGFQLGIQGVDDDGDRIAMTVGMGTVIELASEVVVAKKTHTTPRRHRVALRTDAAFSRKAIVTRSNAKIRFFNAPTAGLPIAFSGNTATIFAGGIGGGQEWFAEGVTRSADPLDFELRVELEDGSSPPPGEPAVARMTCVGIDLDIFEPRISPGTTPTRLTETAKINPGRFVQQRLSTQGHQRAMLVVQQPSPLVPLDFLVHRDDNRVNLFTQETPAAAQSALGDPHPIVSAIIPSTGAPFAVEGVNLSTARRDTGYHLEVVGLDSNADRVAMTVFATAFTNNFAPFATPVSRVLIEGMLNGDRTSFNLSDLSSVQRTSLFRVRMDLPGVTGTPPGISLRSTRADGTVLENVAMTLTRTTGDRFVSLPLLAIPDAIPRSDITFATPKDLEVVRCRAEGNLELRVGAPVGNAGRVTVPVRGRVLRYCALAIQGASPNPDRDLRVANRMYAQCGIRLIRTTLPSVNNPDLVDIGANTCDSSIARSTEEQQLFDLGRTGANACASNLLIYYIASQSNGLRGCAAHPAGQPGAYVADNATQYTMAHELGHVLGLLHVTTTPAGLTNLMIGGAAGNTGTLPANNANVRLSRTQSNTVLGSSFPTFLGG